MSFMIDECLEAEGTEHNVQLGTEAKVVDFNKLIRKVVLPSKDTPLIEYFESNFMIKVIRHQYIS